ncbi:MAG TPA: glycosyltransferase family 2 protein [bacterium]|nr:glycosyltransferase family 2 protein [bacterium]
MSETRGPDISVVSPAYNEAECIVGVVSDWITTLDGLGRPWEIIVADDGSSDGTAELIEGLSHPKVQVVRLGGNSGYGPALSAAMARATGRYVVTIDSDGQFKLSDLPALLGKLEAEQLDLVTGWRREKQDSRIKVAGDRLLNLIVRLAFGLKLRDTNCALKVMTLTASRGLRLEAVGFPTPTEMVARAAAAGLKVGEAPVGHHPRTAGSSKLHPLRSGVQFILFLMYLRFQSLLKGAGIIRRERE